jgi:hypothetical protein
MMGLSGLVIGGSGVLLATIIPYGYEKWKEPHLEIGIPNDDPPGKNRRYMHA